MAPIQLSDALNGLKRCCGEKKGSNEKT